MLKIPQADNLITLHHAVALLRDEPDATPERIGDALRLSSRHVAYTLHALDALGLTTGERDLTAKGRDLARTMVGSALGWELLRMAVRDCESVQLVAPGLGDVTYAQSLGQIAERIQTVADLSWSTSVRRAQTLTSWHRQIAQTWLPFGKLTKVDEGDLPEMEIRYTVFLGKGATGEVWQGVDQLDREVAVKFLRTDFAQNHDLMRDAKVLSRLDHPNIVRVYTVAHLELPRDRQTTASAIVMEYVPGQRLETIIRRGSLAFSEVERIGRAIIAGVSALHAAGVTHEDLHARNILISDDRVKLIDPLSQSTLRADDESTRNERLSSDIHSLKALIDRLAEISAIDPALWNSFKSEFWKAQRIADLERVFIAYLARAQATLDLRPGRDTFQVPRPGTKRVTAYGEFLTRLQFKADPFYHTNAANEQLLDKYFVRPKYFRTLQGEAGKAGSAFVFAPRGSGKTAQCLMLARYAAEVGVLPIIYDFLPPTGHSRTTLPDREYHLRNVVRGATLALMSYIEAKQIPASALGAIREAFGTVAHIAMPSLSQEEYKHFCVSPFGRFAELESVWEEAAASSFDLGEFFLRRWRQLGLLPAATSTVRDDVGHHYEVIKAVARTLRFEAMFVLIDRTDESELARNHAERTFEVLDPILSDLDLLDDEYVGWKVFLWDKAKPSFERRSRTDRTPVFDLEWSKTEMRTMLQLRLHAYSDGAVRSLTDIAASDCRDVIEQWILLFAHYSPRNLVRVLQYVFSEQLELDASALTISRAGLERGIKKFVDTYAHETYSSKEVLALRRIGRPTFTINYLAALFREHPNTVRNKVVNWEQSGLVEQNGTIKERKGLKASNYYMVRDPRAVAFAVHQMSIGDLIDKKSLVCSTCGERIFSEQETRVDDFLCPHCEQAARSLHLIAAE